MLICRSDDCKDVQDGGGSLTKEARIRSTSVRSISWSLNVYTTTTNLAEERQQVWYTQTPCRAWVSPRPDRSPSALIQGKIIRDPREPLLVKANKRNLTQRKIIDTRQNQNGRTNKHSAHWKKSYVATVRLNVRP